MRRLAAVDAAIIIVIVVIATITLAPAVARVQRNASDARCQSNLQRVAEAIALYQDDNNSCFPTNRPWVPGYRVPSQINSTCKLSP